MTVPSLEQAIVRAPQHPNRVVPWGAGRTVSEWYNAGGNYVGKVVGYWAHQMGLGPHAVAKRIEELLKNHEGVLLELTDICEEANDELKDNCLKLMKFALPTETIATQTTAFKRIVALTSRYIGLRLLFVRCKHLQAAAGMSKEAIVKLWRDVEPLSDHTEWSFYLELAASCISDEVELAVLLEGKQLEEVVDVPMTSGKYSVIEKLLVASGSCDSCVQWIAVRYLGRILEPCSFWVQKPHENHLTVIKKLLERVNQLVEDLGVDYPIQTDDLPITSCHTDVQSIDIIASAVANGVRLLDQDGKGKAHLVPRPLLELVSRFIGLLRQPGSQRLLCQSFRLGASPKWNALFSILNRYELTDILVTDATSSSGAWHSILQSVPQNSAYSVTSSLSESTPGNQTVDQSIEPELVDAPVTPGSSDAVINDIGLTQSSSSNQNQSANQPNAPDSSPESLQTHPQMASSRPGNSKHSLTLLDTPETSGNDLNETRMRAEEFARERDALNATIESLRKELADAKREAARSLVEEKQSLDQRLDEERKAKERARRQLDARMEELQKRKSKFAVF